MIRTRGSLLLSLLLAAVLLLSQLSGVSAAGPSSREEAAFALQLVPGDLLGQEDGRIRRADYLRLASSLYDALRGEEPVSGEAAALQRAYELGWIDEPETKPDQPIERQEAYVILTRLIDDAVGDADVTLHSVTRFEDHWQIANDAEQAVQYLYHHRVIGSPGQYVIEPRKPLRVEEAIALTYRAYDAKDRMSLPRSSAESEWEWRIAPIYDGLGPDTRFSNGLAAVGLNGKYGYIDKDGGVAIDFEYDLAYDFSEGRAKVVKDGKTGYIDKEGRVIIPLIYEDGGDFSEEHVWLFDGEAYGFANKYGEVVIPPQYEYVYDFKEGLAPVKRDGKYGYIDPTGATVLPFQYEWASSFSEGLARTGSRGSYHYIDTTGQIALALGYDYLFDFKDGRAIVMNRDQYAVIDRTGAFLIPFRKWGFIYDFNNGLARVHGDSGYEGNYSYIDLNGNLVIGGRPFQDAGDFSEGLTPVSTHIDSTNRISRSYMTRDGELILPKRNAIGDSSEYDRVAFYLQSFSEGLAAVVTWEGKLGFIENPLLKEPVTGEALLAGADLPAVGEDYTLTYSLQASNHVSAQDVTIAYDEAVLQWTGELEMAEEHTIAAAIHEAEPGTIRLKLATLGAEHALSGETDVVKLSFTVLSEPQPGAPLVQAQALLADGRGNEAVLPPLRKLAVDREELRTLIPEARQQHDLAEEGNGAAQYPVGAKMKLRTAIELAEAALGDPRATQSGVNAAVMDLTKALENFAEQVNDGSGNPPSDDPPPSQPGPGAQGSIHELGTVREDGATTVLQVNGDMLKKKLAEADELVWIDVTELGSSLSHAIELPTEAIKRMNELGKGLVIRYGGTSVHVPAGAIDPDGLPDIVRLRLRELGTAGGTEAWKPLTAAVEASLSAEGGIISVNKPLRIVFHLERIEGDHRKAGIYVKDTQSGEWVYQRSSLKRQQGEILLSGDLMPGASAAVFLYNRTFRDLTGHWTRDAVEVMASRHIVFGVNDTDYQPNGMVTRAQFAALAVRLLGLEQTRYDGGFADVDSDAWYANDIAAAVQAGILQGNGPGLARPEERITRQEMAVILMRTAELLGLDSSSYSDSPSSFADDDLIAEWAKNAAKEARQHGLMQGKPGHRFAPLELATRAEAAQVLYRLLEQAGEM